MSVCVVPLPRIPPDERYIVTKVRTVEGITFFTSTTHNAQIFTGFYGVTYYIGFRDDFDVRVGIMFLFLPLCHFDCGLKLSRARIWLKKSVSLKDS